MSRRTGLVAFGGSVLAALVASACCWLPLLLVTFGGSAAGVCPPPRRAMSNPLSRPKRTAAMTSATFAHWAMNIGRLSIIPL